VTLDEARAAIYARASKLVEDASADDLTKVAEAVSKVAYGPQGATTDYTYTARSKSKSVTVTRYPDNGGKTGFVR
jgi:hypothetical protein